VYLPFLRDVPRDAHIVELGCGPGEMLDLLRKEGFTRAVGVDISAEQIAIARSQGLEVEHGDAASFLARRETTVDVILGIDFLEHLTKDEIADLLPRIRSALSEGGLMVFQTVNASGIHGARVGFGDLTHMTLFNESSIRQLLNVYGFEIVEISETGPRPISVKGWVRSVLWKVIRARANLGLLVETGQGQRVWTENLIVAARCQQGATGEPRVPRAVQSVLSRGLATSCCRGCCFLPALRRALRLNRETFDELPPRGRSTQRCESCSLEITSGPQT
jgi:SAM-dependent methyltransferase